MISSSVYKPFDVDAYFVAQAELHKDLDFDSLINLQEWRKFYLREFPIHDGSAMAQFRWANDYNTYTLPFDSVRKFFNQQYPDSEDAVKANLNRFLCSVVALYKLPSGRFTFDRPAAGGVY